MSTDICLSPMLQYLYTLRVSDSEKAKKLAASLPPSLQKNDLDEKKK